MGYGTTPTRLGDLIDQGVAHLQTGPFGTALHASAYLPVGTPVVAVQHVGDGALVHKDLPRISSEDAERLERYRLQTDDIVFCRKGAVERRALIKKDEEGWLQGSDCIRLRVCRDRLSAKFLSYQIGSARIRAWLHQHASGATMPSLNQATLRGLPLVLPDIAVQREIASCLGAFDAKIELNRRMNQTLGAMARALFKSWFVDFEPVVAKSEGRPTGLPPDLDALFPSEFEEDEFGELPVGWKRAEVGTHCAVNSTVLGVRDPLDRLEYVEISAVSNGDIQETTWYDRANAPGRARRRLKHGDTVLSTVRPDRRAFFLAHEPHDALIASTGFAVLRPITLPWSYVHAAMTTPEVSDYLGRQADGGAYPAVAPGVVAQWQVVAPIEPDLLEAFHQLVSPLFDQAAANRRETSRLVALRDDLLPRLLSGEIEVADAQEVVHA